MANDKQLKKSLEDAYDVCWTVSDTLGHIIATGTKIDSAVKSDIDLKKKADNYIKWYIKTFNPGSKP